LQQGVTDEGILGQEAEPLVVRASDLREVEADSGFAWYALHTRHQHEKLVARSLVCKGFEIFLPQYTVVRRWSDRAKQLSLPLFPCYVFVRGGLDKRLAILTTPGVHGFVGFAGRAAAIPEQEIDAVRKAAQSATIEPHPFLKCGDRVRVTSGPLEGVEGVLVRKKNSLRLVLSLELLARSAAVEVDASAVERVRTAAREWK
jgi:transcription antitermination factor NusG